MGILDAPIATKLSQSPLVAAQGISLLGWWDADDIPGADGAAVRQWPDRSGNGNDLIQATVANQPTLKTSQVNGHSCIRTGATGYMDRTTSLFGPFSQPYFMIAVGKTGVVAGGRTYAAGGGSVTLLQGDSSRKSLTINAGSNIRCGQPLDDSAWHIVAGRYETSGFGYVDGVLVGAGTAIGANTLSGIGIGGLQGAGTNPLNGDLACVLVYAGRPSKTQLQQIFTYLANRYSITLGTPDTAFVYEDTTSSNGQNVRIFTPSGFALTSTPLIIWCHPASQTEQASIGNDGYVLLQACLNEGWPVIGSRMHSNSWGNTNSLDDILDAYNKMAARYTITKVVLIGASMGALTAALAIPDNRIANLKGVITLDGVLDLSTLYSNATYTTQIDTAYGITRGTISATMGSTGVTSVPTTSSFPTIGTLLMLGNGTANVETVTTTGASSGTAVAVTATTKTHASADQVSDYPTKIVGHNPILLSAGSFTGVRWRFYASSADTTVPKTSNADAFATLVAAAPEAVVVAQTDNHLDHAHEVPADAVAFIRRAIA